MITDDEAFVTDFFNYGTKAVADAVKTTDVEAVEYPTDASCRWRSVFRACFTVNFAINTVANASLPKIPGSGCSIVSTKFRFDNFDGTLNDLSVKNMRFLHVSLVPKYGIESC